MDEFDISKITWVEPGRVVNRDAFLASLAPYLERIIMGGEDEIHEEIKTGLERRNLHIFLDRNWRPPVISIQIGREFIAKCSYTDPTFEDRSYVKSVL